MASFSVLIVTLTILSLSVNPAFARALYRSQTKPSTFNIIELTSRPLNYSPSSSLSSLFRFKSGNGTVALVIIPANFTSKFVRNMSFEVLDAHEFLGVKFYANVCKISYSGVTNVSKTSNVLKDEMYLLSWIDYHPSSKRLEVRISKFGDPKPVEPLVSVRVDLGELLKGEEVMIGLACSNEKHEQIISYSLQIKGFHQLVGCIGSLLQHSARVIPRQHSSVERYKEKSGSISLFMIAIVCGVCFLWAALFVYFAWLDLVGVQKVQAVDNKHGSTDAFEVMKNLEAAMK